VNEPVTDPHEEIRLSLGAYVLGALTPAERDVVDDHVLTCAECSAELDAFTGLPLYLDLVTGDEVAAMGTGAADPDPGLLDRIVAAAAQERRHDRTRRWLVAVAAALVLIVGSVSAGIALSSGPTHSTAAGIPFSATNPTTHAWAQISVQPKLWGASLNLKLGGVPAGERCRLVAVGRDGSKDVAASWEITYAGQATLTGATSIPLSSTAAYDIVTFDGKRLVHVPINT
jgi:anti-sigma factor RsiW